MTPPIELLLYYDIEVFFNLSSIESMYRSDQDLDPAGVTRLDAHSLTNNDEQFFKLLLKRAASKAYEKLQVFRPKEVNAYYGEVEPEFLPSWGFDKLPQRSAEALNVIAEPPENLHYKITEPGTLTSGAIAVLKNDIVYFDGTNWVKDNAATVKYIFYTLTLPEHFDLNNQDSLDDKVKEFITLYVVKEWFKRQRYSLDLIEPEFTEVGNELGRIINYRRSVKRTVRTF